MPNAMTECFHGTPSLQTGRPVTGTTAASRAEAAILRGAILLTDVTVPAGLAERITQAQADGLSDAAVDAAADGALAVYSLLRFSYLGYRRLFGIITPEEDAERLEMRESLIRAIDALTNLDAETVRQVSEAFVDYFDARHADLRLLDLEYRLGLSSEETLLNAYRDVAYLDAATTLGGVALTTTLARLGVGVTRLRPQAAIVALRSAALRFDGMIAMRRATADTFVARRFAELSAQGHGPQRHEGAVTRRMLVDRVLHGIDPMTGTRVDGVRGSSLHIVPRSASRVTSEADYVAAESYIRRTLEYRDARGVALSLTDANQLRFDVILPIEDVMGPGFASSVEGVRRLGSFRNPQGTQPINFANGSVHATFELVPGGEPRLITLFPIGVN